MACFPHYSVAIRTLGSAGEKYTEMIRSLERQTMRPDRILVYIAEGCPLPARVGAEEYVRCPKGMVTQRARDYKEVKSEYILLCDDDILFAPDSVERLFAGLQDCAGDAISANVYFNHRWPLKEKWIQAAFHGLYPSLFGKYAFRVRKDAYFSYHLHPRDVMETQCFAGAAILLPLAVFRSLSLQDECWMDRSGYPLGEDLVFAYKLHRYGYRVLVHSRCGIVHRDAQTSHPEDRHEDYYQSCFIRYLIWYRAVFQPSGHWGRLWARIRFALRWSFRYCLALLSRLAGRDPRSAGDMKRALREGRAYARSAEFSAIPLWRVKH